jgi:hypothetical protein
MITNRVRVPWRALILAARITLDHFLFFGVAMQVHAPAA